MTHNKDFEILEGLDVDAQVKSLEVIREQLQTKTYQFMDHCGCPLMVTNGRYHIIEQEGHLGRREQS